LNNKIIKKLKIFFHDYPLLKNDNIANIRVALVFNNRVSAILIEIQYAKVPRDIQTMLNRLLFIPDITPGFDH
jgi:hypothetical protein